MFADDFGLACVIAASGRSFFRYLLSRGFETWRRPPG
jgi:hypothetical protein